VETEATKVFVGVAESRGEGGADMSTDAAVYLKAAAKQWVPMAREGLIGERRLAGSTLKEAAHGLCVVCFYMYPFLPHLPRRWIVFSSEEVSVKGRAGQRGELLGWEREMCAGEKLVDSARASGRRRRRRRGWEVAAVQDHQRRA
jgi:hypothetical protein